MPCLLMYSTFELQLHHMCFHVALQSSTEPPSAMQVNAEAIKIGKEADEANAIASECQAGLDKALPALQAAEEALNVLTKKDMSELKVCFLLYPHNRHHAAVACLPV